MITVANNKKKIWMYIGSKFKFLDYLFHYNEYHHFISIHKQYSHLKQDKWHKCQFMFKMNNDNLQMEDVRIYEDTPNE